jgi:serine/threonine protein kinase
MAGTPFGKYQLLERIAAGGMAEIYKARYVAVAGVTKSVVVKKILPHYAGNRNFVSMFINEAKIVCTLSHGNIAQVFDFGEIDGEYYLAMEFVHGQTVSRMLRRVRERGFKLPQPYAAFIVLELAKGLHYAHTKVDDRQRHLHIVHRDVSPQNVIVSYEGQVKIVDFGIAKARTAGFEGDKTQAGAIKGKYVYFSPEQARARDLDGRTDVYACGVVLYEMLCGRLPFEGKMIEVLNRIVRGDFVRPRQLVPDLHPKLEAVIMKAMAIDPEERYLTALELQEALADVLYSIAPRFNQASLAQLVVLLFQDELVEEGRDVVVPPAFLAEVARWKSGHVDEPEAETGAGDGDGDGDEPGAPRPSLEKTSYDRSGKRSLTRASTESMPALVEPVDEEQQSEQRSLLRGRWGVGLAAGTFLLATGLGGGAVVWLGSRSHAAQLQVDSRPPHAAILLDGVDTGQSTPATLSAIVPGKVHRIELRLPTMKPFFAEVKPSAGQTIPVMAELVEDPLGPDAPLPRRPTDPAPVVSADPKAADEPPELGAPLLASYPTTTLKLDAGLAALSIPASRAARTRLDPRATYKLSVEGSASLGSGAVTHGLYYFLERDRSAAPSTTFGYLGPKDAATVSGVRAIYAFVLDSAPQDNQGQLELRARDERSGDPQVVVVDPRRNAVWPDARHGARFEALPGQGHMTLELTGALDLGGKAGRVDQAIYAYDGAGKGAAEPHGLIKSGQKVALESPSRVVLFFPDDDTGDNTGAASVSVTGASRVEPPPPRHTPPKKHH